MNRQEERRKDYGSPRTRMVQVETEGNLCGSATVMNPNEDRGRILEHETNTEFRGDFSNSGWDESPVSQ